MERNELTLKIMDQLVKDPTKLSGKDKSRVLTAYVRTDLRKDHDYVYRKVFKISINEIKTLRYISKEDGIRINNCFIYCDKININ